MELRTFVKYVERQVLYKPFEPANLSKKSIMSLAEDFADEIGFKNGADVEPIVEKLGGRIQYIDLDQMYNLKSSFFLHNKNNFDILIPRYTGPIHDKFLIMREIGHYILHEPKEKAVSIKTPTCVEHETANYESFLFAYGFLVPEKRLQEEIKKNKIDNIHVVFGVYPETIKERLKDGDS